MPNHPVAVIASAFMRMTIRLRFAQCAKPHPSATLWPTHLRALVAGALLLLSAAPAVAGPPSFLCSIGKSWLEKTVCASDRLSALDLELAVAYARSLSVVSGDSLRTLTAQQNKWWGQRAACQKQKDATGCLEDRYISRIDELKNRPDYPGDDRQSREEFSEALIKEGGTGWSQNMSGYMKAIRSCVAKSAPRPSAVLTAWTEKEGEWVAMRLRGKDGQDLLCFAKKDGTQPKLRAREAVETVPDEGPILWLGMGGAPKGACGKPVQVLDTDDTPVGWLSPVKC